MTHSSNAEVLKRVLQDQWKKEREMARISDVEIHQVNDEVRPIYQRFGYEYGPFLNQVKVFAHRPVALKHIMSMLMEMADHPILNKRHLEIAIVAVSAVNQCDYCIAHHASRLVELGLRAETIDRILDPDCPDLDDIDQLVRDYAVQVTKDHNRVSDSLFDRLKMHFDEAQVVELTLRTTLCTFFNKFNDVMQLEVEDGVLALSH